MSREQLRQQQSHCQRLCPKSCPMSIPKSIPKSIPMSIPFSIPMFIPMTIQMSIPMPMSTAISILKIFFLFFQMGFLAAAPFLVKGLCTPMSGLSADILRKSRASTSIVRKVFYAVGKSLDLYKHHRASL